MDILQQKFIDRFWARVAKSDECWLWTASGARGYGHMWIPPRLVYAHRISWLIHYGEIPDSLFVLHHCDNRGCIRPVHLFLGTCQDNALDCLAKDRAAIGSRQPGAKLCEADIPVILGRIEHGEQQKLIALSYGVDPALISRIRAGKRWKHA